MEELGLSIRRVDKTIIAIAAGSLVFGLMLLYQAPDECCASEPEIDVSDQSVIVQEAPSSKILMQVFSFSE